MANHFKTVTYSTYDLNALTSFDMPCFFPFFDALVITESNKYLHIQKAQRSPLQEKMMKTTEQKKARLSLSMTDGLNIIIVF